MPENPLISIITVNLNYLEGLKRTMKSVLEQTYQEFEYIIIDGGSTDGSKEYIEEHSAKIDYWVSEPDKGIYNGMNKGIEKANGEYLLFLNSGDHLFDNEVLGKNYKFLNSHDIIYSDLKAIGKKEDYIKGYPRNLTFSYFVKDTLPHPATFIRASLVEKVGTYDENLKIVSDWKFLIIALFKYNCTYLKVDHIISTFYLNGLSSDPKNAELLNDEKRKVLNSDFKALLPEIEELYAVKEIVHNLRRSRKIGLLVKLGLLKSF